MTHSIIYRGLFLLSLISFVATPQFVQAQQGPIPVPLDEMEAPVVAPVEAKPPCDLVIINNRLVLESTTRAPLHKQLEQKINELFNKTAIAEAKEALAESLADDLEQWREALQEQVHDQMARAHVEGMAVNLAPGIFETSRFLLVVTSDDSHQFHVPGSAPLDQLMAADPLRPENAINEIRKILQRIHKQNLQDFAPTADGTLGLVPGVDMLKVAYDGIPQRVVVEAQVTIETCVGIVDRGY